MLTILAASVIYQTEPFVESARDVLNRNLGRQAHAFALESMPARQDGLDEYSVEAKDGSVHIKGTSGVALCRGSYEYIKEACHGFFGWEGSNLALPSHLPDYAKHDVVCPNQYRHYFNICTFGYTTAWWDWSRWQREIDWMAFHGINMPLAMTGQDKVWQTTFRDLGIPDASIGKFFSGPAFLPWHWMGNINSHLGPLPQSWIDGQASLQKRILARERSLGMTPVTPGFSGFVPVDFSKFHPDVKLQSPTAWGGFDATTFVDPRSSMFREIGRKFIQAYTKEFGTDHLYLCDTFNEQDPQFSPETESQDLRSCGEAVYNSIHDADPKGIWVMQGWLFYNSEEYWTPARVESMLGTVPQGHLVVLDLATNEHAVWKRLPTLQKAGWIYNTLHNYGQSTGLYGELQHFADRAAEDLNNPNRGRMLGMGLTMEGIEQNPIVYELMTDVMWSQDRIDVSQWLHHYVQARYGSEPTATSQAWNLALDSIYSQDRRWYRAEWRKRPSVDRIAEPNYDARKVAMIVRDLATDGKSFAKNPLYQRDLVDLTKTYLSTLADIQLAGALSLYDDDRDKALAARKNYFDLLEDIDRVMACRPEHRLSTWLSRADKWGTNPAEKQQMQENARAQITIWGGPVLYDYANKEWAGLNADFIQGRWHVLFDALDKAGSTDKFKSPDLAAWELAWTKKEGKPRESRPGDPVKLALSLLDKYQQLPTDASKMLEVGGDPGIAVGKSVRDSGGTEGDRVASFAVDGHTRGGYWAASPAPQWLEIDLGTPQAIGGVQLFPYFGDGRYYTYTVETSNDRQAWHTEVDASNNTKPANRKGYLHHFSPTTARYVRVTMLHNSANQGVHLYEVRVLSK